jgi:hypothetical protein
MMNRHDYSMALKKDAKGEFQVFSLSGGDAGVREYKKRRMHKKADSGCLACRAKRVKVCLQLEGGWLSSGFGG